MMSDKDFFEKLSLLSTEFSKYVLEHPEMDDKIPEGAQVVLLLENDSEFSKRNVALAQSQREKGQPAIYINIKGIAPAYISRLIEPKLVSAA